MPELEIDEIDRFSSCVEHVEHVEGIPVLKDPSYSCVYWKHLKGNWPCIISNATARWKASSRWADGSAPDLDALVEDYGALTVPVVSCDKDANRKRIPLAEYVQYCKRRKTDPSEPVEYLKDWHLRKERPEDRFYSVPEWFVSDWLNEYSLDNNLDDFMFVYLGPAGSWTPFHEDVYASFSWSANVVGKKKWYLFPPGEELKLADPFGNLPRCVLDRLADDGSHYEVIQSAGEALFVPSGWHHQVHNLEDTVSVNHNWVNACNVRSVWRALVRNLRLARKEISEFAETDGWAEQCQLMLRASFGIDVAGFVSFASHIAEKRLDHFERGTAVEFDGRPFGPNHILYDLKELRNLFEEMSSDDTSLLQVEKLQDLICRIDRVSEESKEK